VALAAPVVLAGLIVVYVATTKARLNQRLEALRAAGYPTSSAELAEYNKLPEGVPNAADVYMRAFDAFVPPVDEGNVPIVGKAKLPARGEPLPEPMLKAVAQCLAANEKCLALLHEAAAVEHCRYDWDFADVLSPWKGQPHWGGLRSCAFLLCMNTIYHAHMGETNAVVTCVKDGLRLSDSMRREPGTMSYLLGIASRGRALNGLERALNVTTFSDRQLIELDGLLAASEATLDLGRAMITERCFAIERFKAMENSRPPSLRYLLRTGEIILWAPGMQARGLRDTLDYMEEYVQAADLPTMERMARFRQVENELAGSSILHATAKAWVPVFLGPSIFELDPRIRVHFNLARTALAIERYRLATGEVPRQLQELVPQFMQQVPIDPFDGQPIRYKREDPGYRLYSVLDDGQDNGGKEKAEVNQGEPYDWCFIVTR